MHIQQGAHPAHTAGCPSRTYGRVHYPHIQQGVHWAHTAGCTLGTYGREGIYGAIRQGGHIRSYTAGRCTLGYTTGRVYTGLYGREGILGYTAGRVYWAIPPWVYREYPPPWVYREYPPPWVYHTLPPYPAPLCTPTPVFSDICSEALGSEEEKGLGRRASLSLRTLKV